MKQTQQVDIKATLILASGFHFLCCAARACVLPFLTLYFRRLGLSPAMTGGVMAAKHLITLLWSPLAGALTRRYDKRRLAVVVSLVGTATVALLLPVIPTVDGDAAVGRCNATAAGGGVGVGPTLLPGNPPLFSASPVAAGVRTAHTQSSGAAPSGNASFEGRPAPNETFGGVPGASNDRALVDGGRPGVTAGAGPFLTSRPAKRKRSLDVPHPSEEGRREGGGEEGGGEEEGEDLGFLGSLKSMDVRHQLFFLLLMGVAAWELLATPLDWAADDGLYDYLDSVDASDRHGNAHSWGLLGAACGAGGAGLLVNRLPCVLAFGGPVTRGAAHFFCYAALVAPALLAAAAFLPLLRVNRKRPRANGLFKAVCLVRGNPRALLCAVTAVLAGGGGRHAGELPAAAFPHLMGLRAKLPVPWRALLVGAGGVALQCLYYSFLWGRWAALPTQLLNCLSTGALWWAVRAQCEDVAAAGGAERSVRRVYAWLCAGLGASLGSLAGGFVAERFGVGWLLRGVAGGVALWCACLPVLQWRTPHQRRINYSRLLAADASEASDSGSEQERDWLDRALDDDKRHKHNNNNNYGRRMNH
ncbi:unnamed protein product [Merluccius merluccius]